VKEVFADTFFFLALANPGDEAHELAAIAYGDRSARMVTTAWVLTEVGDALAAPGHRERFGDLLDLLAADDNAIVLPASPELFQSGVRLFRGRVDKAWPLTDCISFVVMEQRGSRKPSRVTSISNRLGSGLC
jgi:uncharacterized protein